MAIRKLNPSDYQRYFNVVDKKLGTVTAEVEVVGLDIGDQVAAEWLPLTGLTYDPKSDLVEVILGKVIDHLLMHPLEIFVDEEGGALKSVEILTREDLRHIITLKRPLALPKLN